MHLKYGISLLVQLKQKWDKHLVRENSKRRSIVMRDNLVYNHRVCFREMPVVHLIKNFGADFCSTEVRLIEQMKTNNFIFHR